MPLLGNSSNALNDPADLLCLKPDIESDRLSRMLRDDFGYFFKEVRTYPESWNKVYTFDEDAVERFITVVTVLLAACLLVGSILALYFVHSSGARLGLLAAFTLLFAASVGLLTNAKRSELFCTTAAYAAVLVVFVGSALNQNYR